MELCGTLRFPNGDELPALKPVPTACHVLAMDGFYNKFAPIGRCNHLVRAAHTKGALNFLNPTIFFK